MYRKLKAQRGKWEGEGRIGTVVVMEKLILAEELAGNNRQSRQGQRSPPTEVDAARWGGMPCLLGLGWLAGRTDAGVAVAVSIEC